MSYCANCGAAIAPKAAFCDQCGTRVERTGIPAAPLSSGGQFLPVVWGALAALGTGIVLSFIIVAIVGSDLERSGGFTGVLGSQIVSTYRTQLGMLLYYLAHGIPLAAGGETSRIPDMPLYVYLLPAIPLGLGGRLAVSQMRRFDPGWPGGQGAFIAIPYVIALLVLRGFASAQIPFIGAVSPDLLGTLLWGGIYAAVAGGVGGMLARAP